MIIYQVSVEDEDMWTAAAAYCIETWAQWQYSMVDDAIDQWQGGGTFWKSYMASGPIGPGLGLGTLVPVLIFTLATYQACSTAVWKFWNHN